MASMSNGGLTPVLKADMLAEIGYALAIYPSMFRRLKDDGDGAPADLPLFDFNTSCKMIGFEDVWAFERRWGRKA